MNTTTNWFARHPRARQWAWFVVLWLGGLSAVLLISTPIRLLIDLAR